MIYLHPTDDYGNLINYDSYSDVETLFLSLSCFGLFTDGILAYNVQQVI